MSTNDDDAGPVAGGSPSQPYPQPTPPGGQAYPPMGTSWPPGSPSGGLGPIGQPLDRPPVVQYLRPVQQLGNGSIVLICLVVLLTMAVTAAAWNSYFAARGYLGDALTASDTDRADAISFAVVWLAFVFQIAAAVVFICWLWRTRLNAELLCQAEHRLRRGWVIGSWFCPVANLWFPKQIVDDVWRASDPNNPVLTPTFRRGAPPTSWLIHLWWWPLIIESLIRVFWSPSADVEPSVESLRTTAIGVTVGLFFYLIAAVTIVLIIRRISAWQTQPRQPAWPDPNYAAPMR